MTEDEKQMNEQTQSESLLPCPECGGRRVQVSISTTTPGNLLQATQLKRKTGWFSSKSNQSYLNALTCISCGYTSLHATQPSNLIPDQE